MSAPEPVMADNESSSTALASFTSAQPSVATNSYPEEEVRALREQGVAAEKADKWEDAAECYSRALEKSCPDTNDLASIHGRAFDPLLANLWYLYGTALLYTYVQNTSMFGDTAQSHVKDVASAIETKVEDEAPGDAEESAPAPKPIIIEEIAKVDAEGNVKKVEKEEEVEEIDADAEAEKEARKEAKMEESKNTVAKQNEEEEEEPKREDENEAEEEEGEEEQPGFEDGDFVEDSEEEAAETTATAAEGGQANKEAEENDLELAWHALEIARVMYSTQLPLHTLDLSDTHFSLGNVAWEDEKPDDARTEFLKALKLAEEAGEKRAQAQALLMISSTHEAKGESDQAIATLEQAKSLLLQEVAHIRATEPASAAIGILEESIKEIDSRTFSLREQFTPVKPEDLAELPDLAAVEAASKAALQAPKTPASMKYTFNAPAGFTPPTIKPLDPSQAATPITTLTPKRKAPATNTTPTFIPTPTATATPATQRGFNFTPFSATPAAAAASAQPPAPSTTTPANPSAAKKPSTGFSFAPVNKDGFGKLATPAAVGTSVSSSVPSSAFVPSEPNGTPASADRSPYKGLKRAAEESSAQSDSAKEDEPEAKRQKTSEQ